MHIDKPIYLDFDETLTPYQSAKGLVKLAGKEAEMRSKVIYHNLMGECERSIEESSSADKMVAQVESSLKKYLQEGAGLLRGVAVSRLDEIYCPPSKEFFDISKICKDKEIVISTYTDERIPEKFIERNKEYIPPNCRVVGSRLEADADGLLTGRLEKIASKTQCYSGGDVVVNGQSDLPLCKKAHESGYDIYVVEERSQFLKKALEKFKIPSMPANMMGK
ncbi:MAG: hypothetical protein V1906_02095 [Candidatus Woesearchaeota archaeon]